VYELHHSINNVAMQHQNRPVEDRIDEKKAQSRGTALKIPPKEEVLEDSPNWRRVRINYAVRRNRVQAFLLRCTIYFINFQFSKCIPKWH